MAAQAKKARTTTRVDVGSPDVVRVEARERVGSVDKQFAEALRNATHLIWQAKDVRDKDE